MTDVFHRLAALHVGLVPTLQPILPAPFSETSMMPNEVFAQGDRDNGRGERDRRRSRAQSSIHDPQMRPPSRDTADPEKVRPRAIETSAAEARVDDAERASRTIEVENGGVVPRLHPASLPSRFSLGNGDTAAPAFGGRDDAALFEQPSVVAEPRWTGERSDERRQAGGTASALAVAGRPVDEPFVEAGSPRAERVATGLHASRPRAIEASAAEARVDDAERASRTIEVENGGVVPRLHPTSLPSRFPRKNGDTAAPAFGGRDDAAPTAQPSVVAEPRWTGERLDERRQAGGTASGLAVAGRPMGEPFVEAGSPRAKQVATGLHANSMAPGGLVRTGDAPAIPGALAASGERAISPPSSGKRTGIREEAIAALSALSPAPRDLNRPDDHGLPRLSSGSHSTPVVAGVVEIVIERIDVQEPATERPLSRSKAGLDLEDYHRRRAKRLY